MVYTLKITLTVLLVKRNVKKMINVVLFGVDQRNLRTIHLSTTETVCGGELGNVLMTTKSTLVMDMTSTKDILVTRVKNTNGLTNIKFTFYIIKRLVKV